MSVLLQLGRRLASMREQTIVVIGLAILAVDRARLVREDVERWPERARGFDEQSSRVARSS